MRFSINYDLLIYIIRICQAFVPCLARRRHSSINDPPPREHSSCTAIILIGRASSASMSFIETDRLLLRDWRDDDLAPFAAMNADATVMAHFPAMLSRGQSDALAKRLRRFLEVTGWDSMRWR